MKFSIQTLIWTCVLIAMLIVGVLAFLPQPIDVETAAALRGDLQVTVQEDGKTRIREKYIISAPVAGRLLRIGLDAGDEINEQNRLVAVIMPAEPEMLDARSKAQAKARVDQAQASLARAKANAQRIRHRFEQSQKEYERAKRLVQSISQNEFDFARAEFRAVAEEVRTADFDVDIANYELEMAGAALMRFSNQEAGVEPFEVFSPVHGRVLRVFQESSTVLEVGKPLVEIGDPENIEIEIDVLSTDAVKIEAGAALTVEHWGGGDPLKGIVRVVEPAAFTKISSLGVEEQRVNVIADFDETPERLKSLGDGYRVEARITVDELSNVLLIPNSALFRYQRTWHVFRVINGRAFIQPVEIGLQNEEQTQVLNGLDVDDRVILYPSDKVSDQARVKTAGGD